MPKGDRPHMRYLLDRDTHIKYRRLMKTLNNSLKFDLSDPAKFRLHVIEFAQKYGYRQHWKPLRSRGVPSFTGRRSTKIQERN